jgi:hypothetical protein
VLQDMEKPYARSREAPEDSIVSHVHGAVLPPCATPLTPVTPASVKAFTLLRDPIIQEDAGTFDEVDKQRLTRRLQNLAKAAQISFLKSAFQNAHIRSLLKINAESG